MLFASTRLTLVRELGREHFRETIYATTRDELTPEGFEKHDKHEQLEAPLTEQERDLEGVKQAEAVEGARGTGSREIHLGQRMAMPILDDALAALKELKPDGGRSLVTLVCFRGHHVSFGGSKNMIVTLTNHFPRYRKSTQKPKRSSSSQTRPRRPRYPSSRLASRPPSRASPSSATTTSTPGTRARRSCSSTRAPSRPAVGPSRTACCTR